MLDALISSRSRRDILRVFLEHPDEEYYQNQLSSVAGHPVRAIQRELANLTQAGIVRARTVHGRVLYTINRDCVIYPDLRHLFMKTVGVAHVLATALKRSDAIEWAFMYGSFARGKEGSASDVDMIIIGTITSRAVATLLRAARKKIERELNYVVFGRDEIVSKYKKGDLFIRAVVDGSIEMLLGDRNELAKIFKGK